MSGNASGDRVGGALSAERVRQVACLARLTPGDREVETYRRQLADVLRHVARMERLDLEGVEPMIHPHASGNRWAEDEPGAALPVEVVMDLAPERAEPFIRVPKVLDGGGGSA